MRADASGAKPEYGYIAITFFATAIYSSVARGDWGRSGGQSGVGEGARRLDVLPRRAAFRVGRFSFEGDAAG